MRAMKERGLSDAEYLDISDSAFFERHLKETLTIVKPENVAGFCVNYFQNIQSNRHVLGTKYEFIDGCRRNRRAFVGCLIETFETFPLQEEYDVVEYEQTIELLCPDFPKSIVREAALLFDTKGSKLQNNQSAINTHIRTAIYFQIIYSGWLKEIIRYIQEESRDGSLTVNTFRLRSSLTELRQTLSWIHEQPAQFVLDQVFSSITSSEISFESFLKSLCTNNLIFQDVSAVRAAFQPS